MSDDSLQDSMEPLIPEEIKPLNTGGQIDSLLSQLVIISDDDVIHEPTCYVCSSPFRREIEAKWLDTKLNVKDTLAFIEEKTSKKLSSAVLENHMYHHLSDFEIRELKKREYIDRVQRGASSHLTNLDRIEIDLTILDEQILAINSITPQGDETQAQIEKVKSTETVKLITARSNLLKFKSKLMGEIESAGGLIKIPTDDFVSIINTALSSAENERERKLVKFILDQLNSISRKSQ
jgi:hypothetical protein